MDWLSQLDLTLRGGVLGVLGLVACAVHLRHSPGWTVWSLTALAAGLGSYVIVSAPAPDIDWWPLIVLAMLNPALVWWVALEIFDEAPMVRPWVPVAAIVVLALGLGVAHYSFAAPMRTAAVLLLYGHVLWMAWRGREGDLVAPRRALRSAVLGVGAGLGLIVASVELAWGAEPLPPAAFPIQAAALLAVSIAFALWFLRPDPDALAAVPVSEQVQRQRPSRLSDAEAAVLRRLEQAMHDGAWRREGLTIGVLAAELGTGEHRLRRVINQGLGHRNFAQFINGYRIRAAQTWLSDPAQADRAILQIAHETGFSSLGPFNRAFREITGHSPSEFRTMALSGKGAPKPR